MQAAQSDRRRQRNDKKSANETVSIMTESKDLNKWTPNTQREKEKKRRNQSEKMSHLELTYRPLSAECMRGTYTITELVLSVSFKSPR